MLKTKEPWHRPCYVLNFEHWDFGIVSDFGFRNSDFHISGKQVAIIKDRDLETGHQDGT
jgi:hypothetical protein